jgi:hypothetical protein
VGQLLESGEGRSALGRAQGRTMGRWLDRWRQDGGGGAAQAAQAAPRLAEGQAQAPAAQVQREAGGLSTPPRAGAISATLDRLRTRGSTLTSNLGAATGVWRKSRAAPPVQPPQQQQQQQQHAQERAPQPAHVARQRAPKGVAAHYVGYKHEEALIVKTLLPWLTSPTGVRGGVNYFPDLVKKVGPTLPSTMRSLLRFRLNFVKQERETVKSFYTASGQGCDGHAHYIYLIEDAIGRVPPASPAPGVAATAAAATALSVSSDRSPPLEPSAPLTMSPTGSSASTGCGIARNLFGSDDAIYKPRDDVQPEPLREPLHEPLLREPVHEPLHEPHHFLSRVAEEATEALEVSKQPRPEEVNLGEARFTPQTEQDKRRQEAAEVQEHGHEHKQPSLRDSEKGKPVGLASVPPSRRAVFCSGPFGAAPDATVPKAAPSATVPAAVPNVTVPTAAPRGPVPTAREPVEDLTEVRIAQRQKQVDLCKRDEVYRTYRAQVPRASRTDDSHRCPSTPDVNDKVSQREFFSNLWAWRDALHMRSPVEHPLPQLVPLQVSQPAPQPAPRVAPQPAQSGPLQMPLQPPPETLVEEDELEQHAESSRVECERRAMRSDENETPLGQLVGRKTAERLAEEQQLAHQQALQQAHQHARLSASSVSTPVSKFWAWRDALHMRSPVEHPLPQLVPLQVSQPAPQPVPRVAPQPAQSGPLQMPLQPPPETPVEEDELEQHAESSRVEWREQLAHQQALQQAHQHARLSASSVSTPVAGGGEPTGLCAPLRALLDELDELDKRRELAEEQQQPQQLAYQQALQQAHQHAHLTVSSVSTPVAGGGSKGGESTGLSAPLRAPLDELDKRRENHGAILSETCRLLQERFSECFGDERCRSPNVHIDALREHLSKADVLSLAPPETGAQELLDMILHCNASLGARPDSAWPPARQRNLPKARRVGFFLGVCAASDWIEVLRGIMGSHAVAAVVGSAAR